MNLEREKKIKEVFWLATEMPKEDRLSFLLKECSDDKEMYEEIISLLESHQEAESFLETPVANIAAQLAKKESESFSNITSKEAFLEQLPGRILENKYLVEKQLGQGGMGAVYQATHLGTKRPVALKVIAPQFMTHSEFVERFKREAEAAGRLSHPNVVNVTDFGIATFGKTKIAYLVMEYLKGFTLGELLKKKGKLPISFTVEILEQVCSAISEAHNQGIIHRDLKPDNIWLEPDGRGSYHVKVLDFGLAKLRSNNLSDESLSFLSGNNSLRINFESSSSISASYPTQVQSTNKESSFAEIQTKIFDEKNTNIAGTSETAGNIDPRSVPEWMTRVGMVLGTPLYMSPEQCHGRQLDARTDIYSLGVIAYQMLSGETPFSGNMYQLIEKHSEMPPTPLEKKCNGIPSAIAAVVMTALAKNPSERFPSARAFATALRTNLEGDRPLLHESLSIYWKNFFQIQRIVVPINFTFAFVASLVSTSLLQTNFNFVNNNWIQVIWWIVPLMALMFLGEVSSGITALAIKDVKEKGNIIPSKILTVLPKNLVKLSKIFLQSYTLAIRQIWKFIFPTFQTLVQHSLIGAITTIENNDKPIERSKDLVFEFYSIASSLKLRSLIVKTITYLLFLGTFMVDSFSFGTAKTEFALELPSILFITILLPGLFLTLANPLLDIALALLYFKAREAKGENVYQQKTLEEIEIVEKIKIAPKSKVILAFSLVIAILFSTISYSLIIPPFGEIPKVKRLAFEKVPDAENAWVNYNLAVQDLIDFPTLFNKPSNKSLQEVIGELSVQQLQSPTNRNLEKAAFGLEELDDKQIAYIESHKEAIKHVMEGAKKPKAQFHSEAPTMNSPVPNLLQMRGLATLIAAQVRNLGQNGKVEEALELALVNYKMATDIGKDETASLIAGLISVVCRGIANRSILTLMYSGKTTAEMDKKIANYIAEQDKFMPSVYKLFSIERVAMESSFEDILITQTSSRLDEIFYNDWSTGKMLVRTFPGLRVKVFKKYVTLSQESLNLMHSSADNWDFPESDRAMEKISAKARDLLSWGLSPADIIASYVFYIAIPNATATMKSLYLDNVMGKTTTVFAACLAYKKTHQQFPKTLSAAMLEVGLPIPVDVTTNQHIGYKMENDIPTVWFSGCDGINDGGQKAYSAEDRNKNTPGRDYIFSYGQLPFYINK